VGCVAQLAVKALIEPMGRRFFDVGRSDKVSHAEFHRRGAYCKSVDGFPAVFQILDSREDYLRPRKGVEALFWHEASLDAEIDYEGAIEP
jgi:hypothetical protein